MEECKRMITITLTQEEMKVIIKAMNTFHAELLTQEYHTKELCKLNKINP